jgi:glycosyltransferase involved in cell wall biosynthesis
LQSQKRTSNKIRIGWAGGTTHQSDLLLLKEIIEQTKDEADWIFFGMCPDEIRPLLAEFHQHGDFFEYPARLAALNLDLAVAPLAQTEFNMGKSNLRLLEYGILGIPVICTNIAPYRNSPACLVENTPESWVAALRERIYDCEAREREGIALRNWVQKYYLLENHLNEWLTAHLSS